MASASVVLSSMVPILEPELEPAAMGTITVPGMGSGFFATAVSTSAAGLVALAVTTAAGVGAGAEAGSITTELAGRSVDTQSHWCEA
jgi:hypothetical protein